MTERFIGVEQARGQLGRLVDDVAGGADAISLTKRGRPVAVLVNRDEWEALQQPRAYRNSRGAAPPPDAAP
jgi:prevent-host-death family protein